MVGCTSARKRARKYMEAKDWLKARGEWVTVLKDDPADEEAMQGKEDAEFNLTSDLSLQIRDRRIDGDIYGALDAGVKLRKLHLSWNRNQDLNMVNFRKKQLTALYPNYINILEKDIQKKIPLKGAFDFENYHDLFASYDQTPVLKRKEKIDTQGKALCQSLKAKGLGYPYFRRFVKGVCDYFKEDISSYHSQSRKVGSDLYGNLLVARENSFGFFPLTTEFENAATKVFKNSPWYNPAGTQNASLTFSGTLNHTSKDSQGKKIHTYYNDKQEKKYFEYKVIWTDQKINLYSNTMIKLGSNMAKSPFKKDVENRDYAYEGNAEPYIREHRPSLIKPEAWALKQLDEYEKEVQESLTYMWKSIYCRMAATTATIDAQGDSIMRCSLIGNTEYTSLIDGWYQKNFKIHEAEAKALLKI